MQIIETLNVNHALIAGIETLKKYGTREGSRNGSVMVAPWPVLTVIHRPAERVLFNPVRDANPFFHLFESIWMLAGRRDVKFPATFVKRMEEYSDDGINLHGAYGFRWRHHFVVDQVLATIELLQNDPTSRRAVIAMWDPVVDCAQEGKDFPCNTHMYFSVRGNALDMTVCNRSNDIIWGLYGANTVHLTVLHEFISSALHLELGVYRHLSNNFHLYPKNCDYRSILAGGIVDNYNKNSPWHTPVSGLLNEPALGYSKFLDACLHFVLDPESPDTDYEDSRFFRGIVIPAYQYWKTRDDKWGDKIAAADWRLAMKQWVARRKNDKRPTSTS